MALAIRGGWLYSRALIALSLRAGGSDSPRFAILTTDLIVTFIPTVTSKPHIRFPKFTYVDEKFLGEFWALVRLSGKLF